MGGLVSTFLVIKVGCVCTTGYHTHVSLYTQREKGYHGGVIQYTENIYGYVYLELTGVIKTTA